MPQVTWRTDDDLFARVRHAAASSGRSVNEWITRVLDAATNPDLADSEIDRVRERLSRAGLLEEPSDRSVTRPPADALADARRAAALGTPLSKLVIDGRGTDEWQ
jgi:hypothetical protein